ncbi:hypothetical protein SDC9_150945 [bioreactor metagenome]|uniref:Uncharacterized protein n=1 Tax=bioreactor metagenome TaxID=1076179 RepID=A0A645ET63_9ZZZZ
MVMQRLIRQVSIIRIMDQIPQRFIEDHRTATAVIFNQNLTKRKGSSSEFALPQFLQFFVHEQRLRKIQHRKFRLVLLYFLDSCHEFFRFPIIVLITECIIVGIRGRLFQKIQKAFLWPQIFA